MSETLFMATESEQRPGRWGDPKVIAKTGQHNAKTLILTENAEDIIEGFDLESVDDALNSCVNIFNLYRRFLAYFSPN